MEKRYKANETEAAMQQFWESEGIYAYNPEGEGEVYSIDTPPPTVSGSLHIGHVFSYTQAEMIARYRRMTGHRVFYPFGFDDNGLPTERLVEREHGVQAKDIPRGEFTALCRDTAQKYEGEFKALWQSMGFSVDWNLQYETVSDEVQKISQRSFLELAQGGKAYLKESPVLWCTECQTSIAQAELETADIDSQFVHIPFSIEGQPLAVATTRPELLYGCVCLFVNPEDERYTHLVGKSARVPLYDYDIPVLADADAAIDKGTGVVMCATYGDTTDVAWAQTHNLPYRRVIDEDGNLDKAVPLVGGLPVKGARKEMIRLLREAELLLKTEPITHAVAVHERCGKEVEILPSRQWYIDILSEKERFLQAADEINWYPAHMKSRYTAWVENLKWDWCISRQRYFGVPIPVWYCKSCGAPVYASPEDLPVNPLEKPYAGTCGCGCEEFVPESAVLDTWATSSLTPMINAKRGETGERPEIFPMSMRTQAHEIIRTWAFYTIVKSLYHTGQVPWRDVMICGFVLAKKREKISKSKNNAAFSTQALIETHSADALRYWAANARLGSDTFFDTEELKDSKRFMTKLYNAGKFALHHLEDFDGTQPEEILPVDRWLLQRVADTTRKAAELLDQYEIGLARHEIDALFWNDFCDTYIELAKERLYEPQKRGEAARKSAQWALFRALFGILQLYAPFVPHISEYIYGQYFPKMTGYHSLHLTQWETQTAMDSDITAFGEIVKSALFQARKYKSENNLSMKEPMPPIELQADGRFLNWLAESEGDLLACTGAEQIILK